MSVSPLTSIAAALLEVEVEVIPLDAGFKMESLPALQSWDFVLKSPSTG